MSKFYWGCAANAISFSGRTCKMSPRNTKYEILDMEIYFWPSFSCCYFKYPFFWVDNFLWL